MRYIASTERGGWRAESPAGSSTESLKLKAFSSLIWGGQSKFTISAHCAIFSSHFFHTFSTLPLLLSLPSFRLLTSHHFLFSVPFRQYRPVRYCHGVTPLPAFPTPSKCKTVNCVYFEQKSTENGNKLNLCFYGCKRVR